jgi:hypothetical protein
LPSENRVSDRRPYLNEHKAALLWAQFQKTDSLKQFHDNWRTKGDLIEFTAPPRV